MSGFSPAWLALREPADKAARNRDVLAACGNFFKGRESIAVCDIGAGTGASVRAFADLLPNRQRWTLIDLDAGNLAAATAALSVWADATAREGDALVLTRGTRRIEIVTKLHDLAATPRAWDAHTDLVTASAIMDLTSGDWIARLVENLKADKMPLLATLSANGIIALEPAQALDSMVVASFRAHQKRDKGFGCSEGPDAARLLEDTLARASYTLTAGDSPWVLGKDTGLLQATVEEIASAVAQTEAVDSRRLAQWRIHARDAAKLTIGHRDVFARFN